MNRLEDILKQSLKQSLKKNKKLFIPYLAIGDPNLDETLNVVETLFARGADSIELGLPFTDPTADGPTLQRAFKRVLKNPFSLQQVFSLLEKVKARFPDKPLMIMGYSNLFYQYGFKKILKRLLDLNVRGIVIPDIPYEEKVRIIKNENLHSVMKLMAWIDFVTPTTTPKRLQKIVTNAKGFIYIVSTKGTTGANEFNLSPLKFLIKRLRKSTKAPLVIGFGIREKKHVIEASNLADGFIIGSKIHEAIESAIENNSAITKMVETTIAEIV